MATYHKHTPLAATVDELYAFHANPGGFTRLVAPWMRLDRVDEIKRMADGERFGFTVRRGPVGLRWEGEIRDVEVGRQFVDEMTRGPFAAWSHRHRFEAEGDGSALDDRVEYRPPLGPLGRLAGPFLHRDLDRMFAWRHARTRIHLDLHARFRGRDRLRVAVTGATGLLGSEVMGFLRGGGHTVLGVSRRDRGEGFVRWDPADVDGSAFAGLDGVVHLAGEPITGRWTADKKRRIQQSRWVGTRALCTALAELDSPPRVLVCASATGFYGDRAEEVDEASPPGTGFLAETCEAWEAACEPARAAGIRVVNLRIGVVLSGRGAALATMLPPFLVGLGGPIGSGRQFMPWIALDDVVGAVHHALYTGDLAGPVNAVAPEPARQRRFARLLGRVVRRPAIAPLPAVVVRAVLGEMGQALLLDGQNVVPTALAGSGYDFVHPELEATFRHELGR